VYIPAGSSNTTFTVWSQQGSSECMQQRVAAGAGDQHVSCSRCPLLQPGVTYDLLLVAIGTTGSSSKPVVMQVRVRVRINIWACGQGRLSMQRHTAVPSMAAFALPLLISILASLSITAVCSLLALFNFQ